MTAPALSIDAIISEFTAAMHAQACAPVDHTPIADGQIHRFRVESDKQGSKNGWYVLHPDALPAGEFGTWRDPGVSHTWCATPAEELTPPAKALLEKQVQLSRLLRDQERTRIAEEAATDAARRWKSARATKIEHPYLTAKRVGAHGIRQDGDVLFVPVRDAGKHLRSLQRIFPDGNKRFLVGGAITGHYHAMGGAPDTRVIVCEGYATGASIVEATGAAVAVAFNAGNLQPVAEAIRQALPDIEIVIAADDDRHTTGNPGVTQARRAAVAVDGVVVVPRFTEDSDASDFNDLYRAEGLDAVRQQIEAVGTVEIDYGALRQAYESEIEGSDAGALLDGDLPRRIVNEGFPRSTEHRLLKLIAKRADTTLEAIRADLGAAEADEEDDNPRRGKQDYVGGLNAKHAVVAIGGKVVIMNEEVDPQSERPLLTFSSKQDFILRYQNQKTVVDGESVDIGTAWLDHPQRRQYDNLRFLPGTNPPAGCYNLFRGFGIRPAPGSYGRFHDFVLEIICSGDETIFEYVWCWLAHLFQRPQELPEIALVLRGRQGIGKNTFVDTIGRLIGPHYLALSSMQQVTGRFSGHLANVLLVFANEAIWAGDRSSVGALKTMITDKLCAIEFKGKDIISVENFKRLIVAGNEDWLVPRDMDDRRFVILDVSSDRKEDHEYFEGIRQELDSGGYAALLDALLRVPIDGWHPRHSVPAAAKAAGWDMKIKSGSSVMQWWFDCLERGTVLPADGFNPARWPESASKADVHDAYLKWCGGMNLRHPQDIAIFARELRQFGVSVSRQTEDGRRVRSFELPPIQRAQGIFSDVVGIPEAYWEGDDG